MSIPRSALLAFSALLLLGGGAPSARAACYEIIGCTAGDLYRERDLVRMSCQILGDVRNSIYAEKGYCFRKPGYRRMFGKPDCRYTSAGSVPLNRIERANVAAIRRAERGKGCAQ
jgi:YARHG domain